MRRLSILVALLLALPTVALAGAIPYSGQLTEGGILINGNRFVTLSIYIAGSGGTPIYTQSESLSVVNGIYHTTINAPLTLWDGTDRYVGVAINSGAELTPRVKVGWVPYANYAFHLSPFIFPAPPNGRTVTSTQWTPIDSVIVTVTNPGTVTISLLGYVQWTGSITAAPMHLSLSRTTPTDFDIYYNPPSGNANPLTMTTFIAIPSGQTKIYLWAKLTSAAQTYYVQSKKFQALYIPN